MTWCYCHDKVPFYVPLKTAVTGPVSTVPLLFYGRQRAVGINVTATGAIPQFADRITCIRIFMLLVWIRFVIIGMAACTIRLIGWRCPGDGLRVALMTGCAKQVPGVVARISG